MRTALVHPPQRAQADLALGENRRTFQRHHRRWTRLTGLRRRFEAPPLAQFRPHSLTPVQPDLQGLQGSKRTIGVLINRLASSTVKRFPHLEGAVQRQFPLLFIPVTACQQRQEAKRRNRAANERSYVHPSDYRFTLYPHREAGSENTSQALASMADKVLYR